MADPRNQILSVAGGQHDPTEWQCPCGAWVPIGYSRHPHVVSRQKTFEELHAGRANHESGMILEAMALHPDADKVDIINVLRTKDMPTR